MNVLKLQRKFPQFQQNEIFSLSDAFQRLDVDDKGYLDEATAIKATQQSESQPYDVVRQALKEVELDSSRRVELEDYVSLIARLRDASPAQKRLSTGPASPAPGGGVVAQRTGGHASKGSVGGKIQVQGSSANITHTINEDERTEFTRHINAVLEGDPDISSRLPFPTDTFEMFDECKDGLVLAKLINDSVPDTIDERVLNLPGRKTKNLNAFQMTENNNIVIESCKGIGCSVVNIGAGDIIEVREHLILGLIWQIIRRGLLGKIDIKLHPELYRLLEEDETLEQFLRLPPEQILLRWFNYHLKAANWSRRVNNFSSDVKDGENYAVLMAQIGPEYGCTRKPLQTRDLLQRAEEVLQESEKLGCRKFLTPKSLVAGNPKLNLAFVANLFNNHPALDPITEEEKLEVEDFDAEGEREARVFTLWLNSLDVQPAVVSFFDDLRDGTILLQAYDKVIKGSVNWRHVNKAPAHGGEMLKFKAVENTNYAIELGKQNGFSLVGIQGADITDGQRTLTLGLVWQLMRKDITLTLSSLAQKLGKREITDSEMVRWANDMSRKGGRNSSIRSFKDPAIASGIFLLDVLNGMKSSYVDYDLVTPGQTDDDAYMNAKLSISIARKLGATIWLVPEDICQVRSRLVTTFIGSLMATYEKM
ncbi:Fimbrin [Hirsutella minnesotensis 3608]|nr:Fimbrin [Hirsutella minnesotensis 3608]